MPGKIYTVSPVIEDEKLYFSFDNSISEIFPNLTGFGTVCAPIREGEWGHDYYQKINGNFFRTVRAILALGG